MMMRLSTLTVTGAVVTFAARQPITANEPAVCGEAVASLVTTWAVAGSAVPTFQALAVSAVVPLPLAVNRIRILPPAL